MERRPYAGYVAHSALNALESLPPGESDRGHVQQRSSFRAEMGQSAPLEWHEPRHASRPDLDANHQAHQRKRVEAACLAVRRHSPLFAGHAKSSAMRPAAPIYWLRLSYLCDGVAP